MQERQISPDQVAKAFGAALRRERSRKGISQERLAEACDLDRTYVSMLERGIHQPSLTTIFRLASALEIDAVSFVAEVAQSYHARQKK